MQINPSLRGSVQKRSRSNLGFRLPRRPALWAGLLAMTALISGCAGIQVTYVPLKPGYFPPTRPLKEIPVVTGTFQKPYEELGIILIRKYPGSLEEEIQEKFREEAMMRGADAVIKVRATKQSVFSLAPFFFSFPFSGVEAKGVAIRFLKDSPQQKVSR